MVLKVYDIKKSQQSDLHFAGSFCLVYQAKLTNSKRYILHICDFSCCRLNVRVNALTSNLCSEATNMLYLSKEGCILAGGENCYLSSYSKKTPTSKVGDELRLLPT